MMTMMGRDGCGVGNDDNCDDFKLPPPLLILPYLIRSSATNYSTTYSLLISQFPKTKAKEFVRQARGFTILLYVEENTPGIWHQ